MSSTNLINKLGRFRSFISLSSMIIITCITQVFTLLKSSVVASIFGASEAMDAFNFANSIVSFCFGFIAAGISTIVIPGYVNKKKREGIDAFITFIYLLLLIIVCVMILLRYRIVGLLTNRSELFVNITCNVLVVLLLSNYLVAITNVTASYYQCVGKYNIPKIINLISQIIVVCALLVIDDISIMGYAYILGSGVILNFIIDIITAIKIGWRYKPSWHFLSTENISYIKLLIHMLFSTGVYHLTLMVDATLAAGLSDGKMTILSYASQITSMINSLLIGNLLIYCYPKIVKRIQDGNSQEIFWKQTILFHLIVMLVLSGFFTVGIEGIELIFQHGKFDATATFGVYVCTIIYLIGQQTNVIRDLIYRYFYAIGNTKTPAQNSIIISITNIIVSVVLTRFFGVYGIILGTAIASLVSMLIIMIMFDKKIGYEFKIKRIVIGILTNIIISIITIVIVLTTKYLIPIESVLCRTCVFGLETVFVFFAIALIFKRDIKETMMTL